MKYAEVVVNTPLRRRPVASRDELAHASSLGKTFHYSVPLRLQDAVALGQLVWVPFGPRQLQGIILGFADTPAVEQTKDIFEIADPQPVLTPAQIELARWISQYYLAPLINCVLLMLPPGVERKVELTAELSPAAAVPANHVPGHVLSVVEGMAEVLTTAQRSVLEILRRKGKMPVSQLGRTLRMTGVREVVDQLVQKGLVVRRWELAAPRVRPKTARFARLIADEADEADGDHRGEIERRLESLGSESKQADVLAWLAASDDPLPPLSQVCEAVGCSEAPVRALAEKGLVMITPPRRLVMPLLPPSDLDQVVAEGLGRAKQQVAALVYLRDHPTPVEVDRLYQDVGASAAVLKTLEDKGFVRRFAEDPKVYLALPSDQVEEAMLELRGLRKPLAVLDYLAQRTSKVEVAELLTATGVSRDVLQRLEEHGLVRIEEREVWRDPLAGREFVLTTPPRLTPDQETAWQEIRAGLRSPGTTCYLLHGVTGSGKTEIYLRAIQEVLDQGKQTIALVPEISLTPQTVRRFAARFPGRIAVMHSQLSLGERYDAWRRARAGLADVVIGPRSAVFAPLSRLGLIVLDEEHEWTYKQDTRMPRYHARDVALKYARLTGASVILGSATPAVESYWRAGRGEFTLLRLPKRIMGHRRVIEEQRERYRIGDERVVMHRVGEGYEDARYMELPPVEVVDLRQELRAGNRSIFSRSLQKALARTLEAGEQAILFLNRRGSATFVMCRDCGHVIKCRRCDVPLTYHSAGQGLICHHCNRREPSPDRCPECWSPRIKFFGVGTQRVEDMVHELFPQARTLRWDRDTTGGKTSHEELLREFVEGRADVMIGTQMIAKGLDLPLVTLVGVISADVGLHLPDFRAAERTFQLLTQVAGRAGRSFLGGKVIIQTYTPEHYAVQTASRHDYEGFYQQELAFRHDLGYPPFSRLAKLVYTARNWHRCQEEAERLHRVLENRIARLGLPDTHLIGPAPAFLSRLRGQYRWQIIIRAQDPHALVAGLALPFGWRVDVDPVSLL